MGLFSKNFFFIYIHGPSWSTMTTCIWFLAVFPTDVSVIVKYGILLHFFSRLFHVNFLSSWLEKFDEEFSRSPLKIKSEKWVNFEPQSSESAFSQANYGKYGKREIDFLTQLKIMCFSHSEKMIYHTNLRKKESKKIFPHKMF